jgi:hypothetical protein
VSTELYKVFQRYGINAEGVTLPEGSAKPDALMFREARNASIENVTLRVTMHQIEMLPNDFP